jgi:hypothetical protein
MDHDGQVKLDAVINMELEYDSSELLNEKLLVFNKQLMCITETLQKVCTIMYLQRAQRENREQSDRVLTFIG